ncbi:MAG: NAD(P)-dependent oxidoreductase [Planctomycetota bacterium]
MLEKLISPETTTIGWVGTGVMGVSMCEKILNAGYRTSVFNRTRSKTESLIAKGATWKSNPSEVAQNSDVVFTIVGYPDDVRETYLGDLGILNGCDTEKILVDMTTSSPQLAVEIFEQSKNKNVSSVDAPVSGGDVGARNGTLSIMIGGDNIPVKQLQPLFELMGNTIVHQGPPGSGQHTKMVNQTLIATNMIGVCEALLYAYRAGLDLETVLRSVSSGAAGSWSLSNLAPRIIGDDFEPGFFVEHFIKDMGIALDEANRMGLSLPGLALAKQLYLALSAQGGARQGTQALQLALSRLSAVNWLERTS